MHTDLRAYIERAEDGKILLSFLNDPTVCVNKIEYDGKQLELMSYQLINAFLAKAGIERANFSIDEAHKFGRKAIFSYKPAFVREEDFLKKPHYFAFTRPEFNRMYQSFLVNYCKVEPFEALKANEDESFWRQFFPDAEPYSPSLPKLYGNPSDIEQATLIQRGQIADLRILKEGLVTEEESSIKRATKEILDQNKVDSVRATHQMLTEILIAYIDSIIQRPRAEDWLWTKNLFHYDSKWLDNIKNQVSNEIERWLQDANYTPSQVGFKYPVLSCNSWAVIEVDLQSTDWQVRIVNHRLINIFILKFSDELTVLACELIMFFLMSLGVKVAQKDAKEAYGLAKKIASLWRDKLRLTRHNFYTKNELFDISQHYLEEYCKCCIPKELLIEYNDKFWRLFFPNTKPFYNFLPELIGEVGEIEQAELIRSKQVHNLLSLLDAADLDGQWNSIIPKSDQTLPVSKEHLTNYINEIINRSQAKDWITTKSITYDLAWLRHEMARHNFISPTKLINVQLGK